jgi:L-ascorbate metabolism protein UlaG (beta-lactamase superfamily)
MWSLNRKIKGGMTGIGMSRKALAMNNPDYATDLGTGEVRFEYRGMSCFLITAADGTRIVTDPFHADRQILYPELGKEPADIVTVSCGNYSHCNVYAVGGMPYIYRIKTPTEIEGITFRGVSSRHLEMKEVGPTRPDENIIMCFEVSGIRICHLGALGSSLTDTQQREIGKVDVLMVPVGGVSTLPVEDASWVCRQLDPRVIVPMHYRSERCTYPAWAPVDTFLEGKENIVKFNGFGEFTLCAKDLPSEPHIYVPETRH